MQVDYNIKVPIKNNVHLSNDYGNIILDRIDGHAKISCDYGRLEIGELHGRNNELSFDYTSKSTFEYVNSAKIKADYSGFTIEKAGDLTINSDYTNGTIVKMKNLQYNNNYGKIEILEAHNIQGNGDYLNTKIGAVLGNLSLVSDYGSIIINELNKETGNVSIRTDYTGIKIGYNSDYHFDFEITTEYANVSGKDNFEMSISKEKSSENYYKGYHGSPNSGNNLTISSDYGGINFNQN